MKKPIPPGGRFIREHSKTTEILVWIAFGVFSICFMIVIISRLIQVI